MALCQGDRPDPAVAVLEVVPVDGLRPPRRASSRLANPQIRGLGPILGGAEQRLRVAWERLRIESGLAGAIQFAARLKRYLRGIFASAQFHLNTSVPEGINNRIKVINRMAYGYRGKSRTPPKFALRPGQRTVASSSLCADVGLGEPVEFMSRNQLEEWHENRAMIRHGMITSTCSSGCVTTHISPIWALDRPIYWALWDSSGCIPYYFQQPNDARL